jgi:sodium/bile acid cotransporter 7
MAPTTGCASHWQQWKLWLIKNFLVLGFLFAITLALVWPLPGRELGSPKAGDFPITQTICIVVIFFISGVTLKTADIKNALSARAALVYGIVTILVVTPMLGFAIVQIPFEPPQFRYGLALFACVPTTLTSGVTLVTSAMGNGALALMLTVTTNILGVFTVPFILNAVLTSAPGGNDSGEAENSNAMVDAAAALLLKLVISIIIPMAVGKLVRENVASAPRFTAKYKVELGLLNNASLVAIVWMSVSKSRGQLVGASAASIVIIVCAGVLFHLLLLCLNWTMTTPVLKLPEFERRAVLLMTSQKTLPVAVTVISYLDEQKWGAHGLIAIPCIVGHVTQLFIDAFIASRWAAATVKAKELTAARTDGLATAEQGSGSKQ